MSTKLFRSNYFNIQHTNLRLVRFTQTLQKLLKRKAFYHLAPSPIRSPVRTTVALLLESVGHVPNVTLVITFFTNDVSVNVNNYRVLTPLLVLLLLLLLLLLLSMVFVFIFIVVAGSVVVIGDGKVQVIILTFLARESTEKSIKPVLIHRIISHLRQHGQSRQQQSLLSLTLLSMISQARSPCPLLMWVFLCYRMAAMVEHLNTPACLCIRYSDLVVASDNGGGDDFQAMSFDLNFFVLVLVRGERRECHYCLVGALVISGQKAVRGWYL
ncbi:hypothetical protein BD289DRAFT_491117 [Coniella lustricola]|uniref:Uncharacterized protein n=1 Tax=Coniella lustricola TaxID=2025994 RepID=A0A2T3AHK5_9PEZI|nr:hypothetical protein BD289DRAFT_491117 [Coniella lustricola]